jgi:hypothetical protein
VTVADQFGRLAYRLASGRMPKIFALQVVL